MLLLCVAAGASAQSRAHPIALQMWLGHFAFNEEIRFDGDLVYEAGASVGFTEWLELDLSLSQMRMWDREREAWGQSAGFAMHWKLWPRILAPYGAGAIAGVSFMGLEESEGSDSIAEGLDLGIAWRRVFGDRWSFGVEAIGRLQSFNVVEVDDAGVPLDSREETGYLWSRLLRVGLRHEF